MTMGERTALVCGGSGFLGRHLCRELTTRGWRVIALGRRTDPPAGVGEYHVLELAHTSALRELLGATPVTHVVFVAGPADVTASVHDPELDLMAQLTPLSSLLGAIRTSVPRPALLLVSSAAVYGQPEGLPVSEGAPRRPISPYGYHKLFQEALVDEYRELHGLAACVARPFSIFGPGQMKLAVWDIARRALEDDRQVRGSGTDTRDYLYVGDAVRALALVLERANFAGEAINVASGTSVTIRELTTELYRALGIERAPLFDGVPMFGAPSHWEANIGMLRSLGFEPQVTLRDGLQRTAAWIRRQQEGS